MDYAIDNVLIPLIKIGIVFGALSGVIAYLTLLERKVISSIGILGIILGGWASNSKYPLLGALRSAAQMVSYEVALGFSIMGVLMLSRTLSLVGIVEAQRNNHYWYVFLQPLGFILFFI